MGSISKAIDRLPSWVKVILLILTLIASAHTIARKDLGYFLLRVIFSPMP